MVLLKAPTARCSTRKIDGDPYGNRTRASAVRWLNRHPLVSIISLTKGAFLKFSALTIIAVASDMAADASGMAADDADKAANAGTFLTPSPKILLPSMQEPAKRTALLMTHHLRKMTMARRPGNSFNADCRQRAGHGESLAEFEIFDWLALFMRQQDWRH